MDDPLGNGVPAVGRYHLHFVAHCCEAIGGAGPFDGTLVFTYAARDSLLGYSEVPGLRSFISGEFFESPSGPPYTIVLRRSDIPGQDAAFLDLTVAARRTATDLSCTGTFTVLQPDLNPPGATFPADCTLTYIGP